MLVCAICNKELKCIKTGMAVRYNIDGSHAYVGDLFKCPTCGATIANTNRTAIFEPIIKYNNPYDIWMNNET